MADGDPAFGSLDDVLGPDDGTGDNTPIPSVTGTDKTLYVPWFGMTKPRAKDFQPQPLTPNQADRANAELFQLGSEIVRDSPAGTVNPNVSGTYVPPTYLTEGGAYTPDNMAVPGHMTQAPGAPPGYDSSSAGLYLRDSRQVALDVYNWTDDEYSAVVKRMQDAGMVGDNPSRADVVKQWGELVSEAADYHLARPGDLKTPIDMIDMNHASGTGTTSKASIDHYLDKTVTITTQSDARAVLNDVLSKKLGRRATAREVDDFQAALNTAQRNSPRVSRTTASTDATGHTRSTTDTTTGGVDVGNFADDYTDYRDPDSEFGRYQAATTYYNALLQAISGPVPQIGSR